MKPIRLLVADEHTLFRSGLVSLLKDMPEFQVVGETANGREAVEAARRLHPDVILLDVNMPVMDGVETVRALKDYLPCRILMLTISQNDEDLFGAILAGADGYLLKNVIPDELSRAIVQVYEGMVVLSPDVTRKVISAVKTNPANLPSISLSSRELDVLNLLARGKTTPQIALELFISENTVKTHVRHITEKMEASNRAEAVSKAMQLGLILQES